MPGKFRGISYKNICLPSLKIQVVWCYVSCFLRYLLASNDISPFLVGWTALSHFLARRSAYNHLTMYSFRFIATLSLLLGFYFVVIVIRPSSSMPIEGGKNVSKLSVSFHMFTIYLHADVVIKLHDCYFFAPLTGMLSQNRRTVNTLDFFKATIYLLLFFLFQETVCNKMCLCLFVGCLTKHLNPRLNFYPQR